MDIHQNFICSSHLLNRKKRSESAQTAFMPLPTHTASHFCYSIDNPQGYLCRLWSIFIVQYTALTPSNHSIFLCSLYGTVNEITKIELYACLITLYQIRTPNFHFCSRNQNFIIPQQLFRSSFLLALQKEKEPLLYQQQL